MAVSNWKECQDAPKYMRPIVVVGSINMDLVFNTAKIPAAGETISASGFKMYPGGKGANQAVAAARLGHPVQLIGKLGSDIFGEQLRSHLESAHVGLSGVTLIDGASGTAAIIVTEDGENSIVVNPGANLAVSPEYLESQSSLLCNAAIVLTQLEIPVDTVECLSSMCARNHVPLILDPAPARDLPRRVLERVRWFTPNETEAAFYAGQMNPAATNDLSGLAKRLRQLGPTGVLLKSGARGVYVSSDELEERVPAPAVKVVDTTAAGDTFNGAFAVALMRDKPLAESIRFAIAAASVSVTRAGAQPSMPTLEEVQETILAQR
jgi:ribokinase